MPAGPNEQCGWCAYHVPEGAHICGACGATRHEVEVENDVGSRISEAFLVTILGGGFGFIGYIIVHEPKFIFLGLILGAWIGWNNSKTGTKIVWNR